jgi:hypothetical protein
MRTNLYKMVERIGRGIGYTVGAFVVAISVTLLVLVLTDYGFGWWTPALILGVPLGFIALSWLSFIVTRAWERAKREAPHE